MRRRMRGGLWRRRIYNGAGFWNQGDIYQVCYPISSKQEAAAWSVTGLFRAMASLDDDGDRIACYS